MATLAGVPSRSKARVAVRWGRRKVSAIWMALPGLSRTGGDKQAARDVISAPEGDQGQTFIISLYSGGKCFMWDNTCCTSVCCLPWRLICALGFLMCLGPQCSSEKCFASLCTVRCAFVIYNVNRKWSQGSFAILAENGLGNLKRFLICNAFLWIPGDYLHMDVLAKGAGPLHGVIGM